MRPAPQLLYRYLWLLAVLCAVVLASPRDLFAEATPPPGPGVPILPAKPTATPTVTPMPPAFQIVNHYTAPQQTRSREPFDLHLEIKNVGNRPASGYTLRIKECTGEIQAEGVCVKPLPDLAAGQSAWVAFRLRLVGDLAQPAIKDLILQIADNQGANLPADLGAMTVKIHFLPSRAINDETPDLKRPFPGPDITIGRTWTAKARSTVAELLTPVPVRLDAAAPGGGPEFELVVELHNQGPVEATNIFVDFCAATGDAQLFNPVGSTCRKFVPANLPAGAKAIASQTLAFKNSATPTPRGAEITLRISYEFWYVEQWLKGEATPTVAVYPQEYPAPLLPPYTAPQLIVNTAQLNVRLGPDTNYPVLGQVHSADVFAITGRTAAADWWQINYNGQPGWVSAAYVIARGGENVAEITLLPTPPPAAPAPAGPTPSPNPGPVGQQPEPAPAAANIPPPATIAPPAAGFNAQADLPARAGSGVAADFNAADSAARLAGPWVVIERYRTAPQPIVDGQPFTLELTLRNPGRQTAGQLTLAWRSNQIAALGAGNVRWLGDLLPGAATTVSGQFLVTDPRPSAVLRLPVELLYSDDAGQTHAYRDEITLLRPTPQPTAGPLAGSGPTTPQGGRPAWLSALLGFLGLGRR